MQREATKVLDACYGASESAARHGWRGAGWCENRGDGLTWPGHGKIAAHDPGGRHNWPVGVGKSAVLREADALLISAGVAHATIELEDVARFWGPEPSEGRTRPDVAYRNLASLWSNYNVAGADRLLLSLLMERSSDLDLVRAAVPNASITVVQLHAPLSVIEERVRLREKMIPEQELSAARWWVSRLEESKFADYLVDNSNRPPRDVAVEVLRALGWLK